MNDVAGADAAWDLVIRGGLIVDGDGGDPYMGDVGVKNGVIGAVGVVTGRGGEEIAAAGRLVTPGWVDIHTHYDGQVTWDSRMTPSSLHGATTVVMGNCGVGFAPARPQDRETLIRLMEGVEDIPGAALAEGLSWAWESFPEYMDAIETLPHDVDVAVQVPHGALRVYVMGDRGAHRAPATNDENQQMRRLVAEAVEAGALGFSTTRTMFHRTADGDLTPTVQAQHDELRAIAQGLGDAKAGVMQFVSDFTDIDREFGLLCELSEISSRPLSFSLVQSDAMPGQWRDLLGRSEDALARGLPIRGQVCGRPVGLMLGLQGSVHPLIMRPSYQPIADLPLARKVAALRDPMMRAQLLNEPPIKGHPFNNLLRGAYHKMYELGDPPNYEPDPADSLAARASREGRDPDEILYDALLADEGRGFLFFPLHNYIDGNLDNVLEMLKSPATLVGLSDGGAHVGAICDVSLPTFMLTHWCRDRAGERLDLASVVRSQSRDTAESVGLFDRGRLKPGYKADINVIDFERLRMKVPHMIYDLPGGGRRLMQGAEGYGATIVSGVVVYREGEATGALPGKLVRGGAAAAIAT